MPACLPDAMSQWSRMIAAWRVRALLRTIATCGGAGAQWRRSVRWRRHHAPTGGLSPPASPTKEPAFPGVNSELLLPSSLPPFCAVFSIVLHLYRLWHSSRDVKSRRSLNVGSLIGACAR